jgi:hypothetical protein
VLREREIELELDALAAAREHHEPGEEPDDEQE